MVTGGIKVTEQIGKEAPRSEQAKARILELTRQLHQFQRDTKQIEIASVECARLLERAEAEYMTLLSVEDTKEKPK
jgi:hypothetical protein